MAFMAQASERRGRVRVTKRPGVTLLELVVVLLVIALSTGVVAVALPGSAAGVQTDARELTRLLAVARRTALEHGRGVEVSFLAGHETYRVRLVPHGALRAELLAEGRLPAAISVSDRAGGTRSVYYDALGRGSGGPIEFRHKRGKRIELGVDPWTGRTDVSIY